MGYELGPENTDRKVSVVKRVEDGAYIPFDTGNTDCQQFLADWKAGAVVTDASGEVQPYSADAVKALGLTPV